MATTRDEVYDEVHEGLTWDQREGAYLIEPGTPWDDEGNIDGVYRNERGLYASAEAVNDSLAHNLKDAGL